MAIILTEKAANEISRVRDEQKLEDMQYLRIGVTGGGCSGLAYKLKFVTAPRTGDLMIPGEVPILIDTRSALYLKGMTLDYSDKLVAGGFKFNNPNAKASMIK